MLTVNGRMRTRSHRLEWITLGVGSVVIVGVLCAHSCRGKLDASRDLADSEFGKVLNLDPDHKMALWSRLPFDALISDEQVENVVASLRTVMLTDCDKIKTELLTKALTEYLKINRDWDVDAYLAFCKKRDMVIVPDGIERSKQGAKAMFKLLGAEVPLPDDPYKLFKYLESGESIKDAARASGKTDAEAKRLAETFSTSRAPVACATAQSFITISAKAEELPVVSMRHHDLFRGPRRGTSGGGVRTLASRLSPQEMVKQGHPIFWAEVAIILKTKSGEAIPHSLIFFWNDVVSEWILETYIFHYPQPRFALLF